MFPTRLLKIDHLPYTEALALMRKLVDIKGRSKWPEVLLILEHEPVFTLGRRGKASDILIPQERLQEEGIDVHRIERGGLITYHGPGQLVAYPIFNLRHLGLRVVEFVHKLEDVVMDSLIDFGITANRREGSPGVWVGEDKIASLGVAVRKGVTFHGLALNYDPDLTYFDMINPCGMNEIRMTSMSRLLGQAIIPTRLGDRVTAHFANRFELDYEEWSQRKMRACLEREEAGNSS